MLFENFQGDKGRLPEILVSAIQDMCKEQGLRCKLDGHRSETWLDIYCNGIRTCVSADPRNGQIKADSDRGVVPLPVAEVLTHVDAQLQATLRLNRLFENFQGDKGRLPEILVSAIQDMCKEQGLRCKLDADQSGTWLDIYCNGIRTCVSVDPRNGQIKADSDGDVVPLPVAEVLTHVDAQLQATLRLNRLFENFQGDKGRLPEILVSAIQDMCKEQGLRCKLDADQSETWLDIYCNGIRTCVSVDPRNGQIKADSDGDVVPLPVAEVLTHVDAQLQAILRLNRLFENFQGDEGRLPEILVSAIQDMCKEQGLRCKLDADRGETWLDIYCNGIRTCVSVDPRNGQIKADSDGDVVPLPVAEVLTHVDAQLSNQHQFRP